MVVVAVEDDGIVDVVVVVDGVDDVVVVVDTQQRGIGVVVGVVAVVDGGCEGSAAEVGKAVGVGKCVVES